MTLTGFGGVGKTRLALRVAAELRRAFTNGVCFVSFGELNDPEWLSHTVAAALGMQGRSTQTAPGALVEYLAKRNMLLIMDNCEHLVDACAMLTDALLRTCPDLRVIATSRAPLHVRGENIHAVAPLTVPAKDAGDATLRDSEAVRLFVDRARAAVPGFELNDDNREAVADVCRKLEGIPLAIELAVARLRAMAPSELAQHLTDRWELLTVGSRDAPDRQQTMAACIEWSYELCTEVEQDVWARAATFAGGFELDAAQALCVPPGTDPAQLPDLLLALVDKSVLSAEHRGGTMRYRMLPAIRHRGIRRLREVGVLDEVRRQHRDWYVDLALRAEREWMSPKQVDWVFRLRREQGNMAAALEFCHLEPGEAEPGLRMGASLLEFGLADGLFRPGRTWFDRLLVRDSDPTETRALATRVACWWSAMQGDIRAANRYLEDGESISERFGEPVTTLLRQARAFVAMFSGDISQAINLYEEVLQKFEETGDDAQQAHTLALLALAYTFVGDVDRALACHEKCFNITEAAGESWFQSYSLWIAGLASWAGGDADTAVELERQSLRLKRAMNEKLGIGLCLEALAWMIAPASPARATEFLGAAEQQWETIETSTKALPGLFTHHEACVATLRSALDDEQFERHWQAGKSMSESSMYERALEEQRPESPSPPERPVATKHSDALTRRERQVAGLVANGLTNKDIADTLVVSKRTAETHVENILTKLGFTSRHEIAAWVVDRRGGTHDET